MPAYVLRSDVAVAVRSNGAPALTVPELTGSPVSRVASRASPVRADSSRTALTFVTMPSTGTTSPGFTMSRSPTSDLGDGPIDDGLRLVPMDGPRRPGHERRQLAVGPTRGKSLEPVAGREHHADHGRREVLPEQHGTGDGQDRDDVDARLAVEEVADDRQREPGRDHDGRYGPGEVARRRPGPARRGSARGRGRQWSAAGAHVRSVGRGSQEFASRGQRRALRTPRPVPVGPPSA